MDGCPTAQHFERWRTKQQRNNAYRREQRADARAAGTVYRKGRGNLTNKAAQNRKWHLEFRGVLFEKLGGARCVRCGFANVRALQLDHVDGGGNQHRKALASGTAYYRALSKMSATELVATFQVLCANCNVIKREEREEWRWHRASEGAEKENKGVSPSS